MFGLVAFCLLVAAVLSAVMFATPYEEFGGRMPYEKDFELVMVDNSTVEAAVEIDTDLDEGSYSGWNILGFDYQICVNTEPYLHIAVGNTAVDAWAQLCRGDVPNTPVKLKPGHRDLIMEDSFAWEAGDATSQLWQGSHIHKVRKMAQTQLGKIYFMFGTVADWAAVSADTNSIFGTVYYFPVKAPRGPREAY
jgi:hypothetical protein